MSHGSENPFAIIARHQESAPVNVDAIAQDLGIKVYLDDLGSDVFGSLMRDRIRGGPSGYMIQLNRDNFPNRRRFTLAHEIAHFVLHRDLVEAGIIDKVQYRSALSNMHEAQANQLAADILMPRALVEREFHDKQDNRPLWARFSVSEQAMEIRLKSLRLKS